MQLMTHNVVKLSTFVAIIAISLSFLLYLYGNIPNALSDFIIWTFDISLKSHIVFRHIFSNLVFYRLENNCPNTICDLNNMSDVQIIKLERPLGSKQSSFFKKGGTFKGNHWFHMGEYYLALSQNFRTNAM